MKQKNYFKLFVAVLGLTLFFVSCQKGDAGPAGPAGAQGAQGATGTTGPKGDTGTANVIYSAWLTVLFTVDTIHIGNVVDTVSFTGTITANKLTSAILNSGEIKVYLNLGTTANPLVVPLPYVDLIYSDGISVVPQFTVSKITLKSNISQASTVTQNGSTYQQYRYILIPGAVPGIAAQPVDWNDYNKVKTYMGLKD